MQTNHMAALQLRKPQKAIAAENLNLKTTELSSILNCIASAKPLPFSLGNGLLDMGGKIHAG